MPDQKKLEALRAKYATASGGDIFDPEFKRVADTVFSGERRKWPFAEPATFCGAPYRPEAYSEKFKDLDVALIGVPMDLGVTNRAGARLGAEPVERAAAVPRRRAVRLFAGERPLDRGDAEVVQAVARAERVADVGVEHGVDTLEQPRVDHVNAAGKQFLRGTAEYHHGAG